MRRRGGDDYEGGRRSGFPYMRPLIGIALLVAIIAAAYVTGSIIQKQTFGTQEVKGDLSSKVDDLRTVNYNRQTYMYNNGLTTILLMGVDKTEAQLNSAVGFRNGGQSDYLELLIINSRNKTVTWLPIDRDTMTEITVLGVLGNYAGTKTAQICLSHGFGDGKAQSCEYTVSAVETLLFGIDVDFYISLDLTAIEQLNEAVGGIEVTLDDDLSMLDPVMTKGTTLTLHGDQAEYFVRSRTQVGEGTNEERMRRQAVYMKAFRRKVMSLIKEDSKAINTMFDRLEDYIITDMKRGRMINEANRAKDYAQLNDVSIAGEHSIGSNGFMEFHADTQALEALVVNTFFEPIDDKAQ